VCWLAAVLSRGDRPSAGQHTWESNALGQKNLAVVDLAPDSWWTWPFVTGAFGRRALHLELVRPRGRESLVAMLVQRSGRAFEPRERITVPGELAGPLIAPLRGIPGLPLDLDAPPDGTEDGTPAALPDAIGVAFPPGARSVLRLAAARTGQLALGLSLRVPPDAVPGDELNFDLLARDGKEGRVVGGLAVQVRVVSPTAPQDAIILPSEVTLSATAR
jgi:hypothetical protein